MSAAYVTNLAESKPGDSYPFGKSDLNTGNLLFYKAIIKTTGLPVLTWQEFMKDDIAEKIDTIVTSDMIWIRKGIDFEWLFDIKKKHRDKIKIIPLCIGFEHPGEFSPTKDIEYFFKSLSEQCCLACRGEYTVDVLEKMGIYNTIILGCPSLYYNENAAFEIRVKELSAFPRIAANATLWPKSNATAHDFREFISFCMKNHAEFIEQTYFDWFSIIHVPEEALTKYIDWKWGHVYFFEINPWIEHMRNFDFVIGGRFHGCVSGILANVPSLVLTYDKRIEEMCRYFEIPQIPFKSFDSSKPPSYYYEIIDYSAFNKGYRERYEKYIKYLKENKIYNKNSN